MATKATAKNKLPNKNNKHKNKRNDKCFYFISKIFTVTGKTLRGVWTVFSVFALIAVILFILAMATFNNIYTASRAAEYEALSSMSQATFEETGKTIIYDVNNKPIATMHNTGYKYAPINEISEALQKTYISSEDKDFLLHDGFSVKGIARAAFSLVKNKRITQGGSTITQQLVKNTLLSSERTFFRKLTEVFLAVDLEKKFTKADIMEYYLNSCFYGNNCKGIYAASEYYFGKAPSEINYLEAASLAAISKSPSAYNPEADKDRFIEERNIVLKGLFADKLITKDEYEAYKDADYLFREHETKQEKTNYAASFAIYCAARQLMSDDGFKFRYRFSSKDDEKAYKKEYSAAYLKCASALRNGGYRIYTSIDMSKQNRISSIADKYMTQVSTEKNEDGRFNTEDSITVIDNETGYVTAIVGGRGDEYNRAFLSTRQPGSAIKPILDYGPAFDTGKFFPGRVVSDKKSKNGPKNSEGTYLGSTTIREAIVNSRNTVAYDTLQSIGLDTGLSYLKKMHVSSLSYLDEVNMSTSIGGFTNGIKNYELAACYRAIANRGVWQEGTCVTKIDNLLTGKVVKTDRKRVYVYKNSSAYMLCSALSDVITKGTGKGLSVKGVTLAGKTGTTNSLKDGWFVGFSPETTVSVWVGNDDGSVLSGNYGARYAGKLWQKIMSDLCKGEVKKTFTRPASVTKQNGDYVAVADKDKATEIKLQDEEKAQEKMAGKTLASYEAHFIETEDDIYKSLDLFDKASEAIASVDNDKARIKFLKRLNKKKKEMDEQISMWGSLDKTREEYEQEQEEKKEAKREEENRQNSLNAKLTGALSRFNKAIDMINSAEEYSPALDNALSIAEKNLAEFSDTDDYESMLKEYNEAADKLDELKNSDSEEGDDLQ